MADGDDGRAVIHVDLAADGVGERGYRTLVGDVLRFDASLHVEKFAGQMRDRAAAAGTVIQLPWFAFGEGDKVAQIARGYRRMCHQHQLRSSDGGDGGKISDHVVGCRREIGHDHV